MGKVLTHKFPNTSPKIWIGSVASCHVHVWRIFCNNCETWSWNSFDIYVSWYCVFSLKDVVPQFSLMGIAYHLKQGYSFILLCNDYNTFVNNQDQNIFFVLSHMTLLNHPYRYCDSWGHKEPDTTEWLNWTEQVLKQCCSPQNLQIQLKISCRHSKMLYHMHSDQLFKM